MEINKKDFPWLIILGLAIFLFLNIFISIKSPRHQIIEKQFYPPLELGKNNKSLATSPKNINPIMEDEESPYLPFKLLGTIVGNPCLAFIYNSNTDKHMVCRLNDLIEDYKILNIRPAKVILEKNGHTQELLLASGSRKYIEDKKHIISADASGTVSISRSGIISMLPKANELLGKVKILRVPGPVSNKLMGFRIDNVPSGSLIEDAGIKSGDIVYSVEGRNLENVKDAMQMLSIISKQSSFEVVLLRYNKPVTLRYEFRN